MTFASGIQIAFLVFAVEFFAMLAARWLAPVLGWPADRYELLGQSIVALAAAAILFGVPALRRYCMAELRRPIPLGAAADLAAALATKAAIPFAVAGAIVAWAFATGGAGLLEGRMEWVDPAAAWKWVLSPYSLARLLVLSWIVGPVIEELVFRGLLYRAFERRWGWPAAMALTSLLFGLVHPTHFAASALGSVVLVGLLRRTGTLRACIAVHSAFNILISWPLLGQVLLTAPAGDPARLSTWTLPLACLAFVTVALPACLARWRIDVRSAAEPGVRQGRSRRA